MLGRKIAAGSVDVYIAHPVSSFYHANIMASFQLMALGLYAFVSRSEAFWRMPCRSRTGLARIDPIISSGTVSEHAHAIHGGNSESSHSHPARFADHG